VSGHMMPLQLKKALRQMNGRRIFPVHTESAGLFVKFIRDLKGEVTLVEKSKEYTL
jgi:mRNA degradation ribonuclease J1/J2